MPAATAAPTPTAWTLQCHSLQIPFDAFLTGSSPFEELPDVVHSLSRGTLDALCHVIEYPQDHPRNAEATR